MSVTAQNVARMPDPEGALFDVESIRADFPILSRRVYGKELVYLDNAASAQKPRAVLDAMREAYECEYANVHRGAHFLSNAATEKFEAARETARRFLNAADAREIVFTRNGTEAINLVAASFLRPRLQPGDEIVLSVMEHHSNIVPWHLLREEKGAQLRWAPVHEDGSFDLEGFAELLGPRTKLVAITHMSNVLGTIAPLRDIIRLAHARDIPVLVDGCQGAVHLPVDVRDLGCDFYVVTGHKLYGPTGIGALYGRLDRLESMPPYQGGGEMIREVGQDRITYAPPPQRFEAGTPAIVQAIGLGAALTYVMGLDREAALAHEQDLLRHATERLSAVDGLRIVGTAPDKGAIVSFALDGVHPHDVSTIIDREGVAVRAGHHCAQVLMRRYDLVATSRASFAIYNTRAEVDALAAALVKCKELFG